MAKLILQLIGPTIMILIGLIVLKNVPITFGLFYGWLAVFSFYHHKKKPSPKWGSTQKSVLLGIISGLLCLISIYGSVYLLQESVFDLSELKELLVEWNFTGSMVIWLVLFLIFINPILEELYWRDYMFGKLVSKVGAGKSITITAFFYSLYHLLSVYFLFSFPFNFIAVVAVFIAGIMWGYFRFKTNSIVAPIFSHAIADLGIMLVYLHFVM
ncbi:CPBP family intramembrane glutamic endopeptidase [Paenisporosarcina cavernae]|uniref:CPBP family intramembrane metalloprotease n=1 Tax=Paenisporosarcina cavernae TaxID=2320858 RepID=A0A385YP29_9BACL|nr:CPBP family intramembrane glutamic endopeptidase [Paenisporosarcina cavernae]AYC28425.1 CPBP family intramembrane metalloprotease [Paenisporosarcina cavernae]